MASHDFRNDRRLRVMTYNIRGAQGMDGRRSVERIAALIRSIAPDLAALQEVHCRLPWSGFSDQPRRLAQLTGMRGLFRPSFRVGIGGYGNAWLSRLPDSRCAPHRLPGRAEPRTVLELTAGARLRALATHFGLATEEKQRQAQELVALVEQYGGPTVVAGDLNARPDSGEVAALLGAGLRHAVPPEVLSFPAGRAEARIDYLLIGAQLRVERWEVVDSLASDHLPLVADLSLEE